MEVEWEHAVMPFKHVNATPLDAYFIKDPTKVEDAHDSIKKILDAKYEPANLDKVCSAQSHLAVEQQQKLLDLFKRHRDPFDGGLGTWTGSEVDLELNPGAQPHHARAYPIPKVHIKRP